MRNSDSVCYPISELLKLNDKSPYLPFLRVAEPSSWASSFHLLPFPPVTAKSHLFSFKIWSVAFSFCICVHMYFFSRWVIYGSCFRVTLDYKISTPLKIFSAKLCLFSLFTSDGELVTIFQIDMTDFLEPFNPSKLKYCFWLFAVN